MVKNTRIYGEEIKVDSSNIQDFWEKRAASITVRLNSVLLGDQTNNIYNELRNKKENDVVVKIINENFSTAISILDLGCGNGRWAENFLNSLKRLDFTYHGIDFSEHYIHQCKEYFKDKKQFIFEQGNIVDFLSTSQKQSKKFDFIIVTGVMMYINDDDTIALLKNLNKLKAKCIYIQESVSLMKDKRLTLDRTYSQALQSQYSAIYRTIKEYTNIFKNTLTNYDIFDKSLLLESHTNQETNANMWLLKLKEEHHDC